MKKLLFYLLLSFNCIHMLAFTSEIKSIKLNDGEEITTRLCLPDNQVKVIIFCIPGTGTSTYIMKRETFNYFDEIANGFCESGIAFFTYNRRGCEIGEDPPMFVEVDSAKYSKYTPLQEAEDVEAMISSLVNDPRFNNVKIILYGVSEGTVIAPIVVERKNVKIDALLLHGYAHENMYDIIKWQNEGNGVMLMINSLFDQNKDNAISKEEYENISEELIAYKTYLFQDLPFESLDLNKDGFIDIQDIKKMRAPFHDLLMKHISADDELWIKDNYLHISTQWFKKHFELEPNKTRLLRIDIPIHIFHGVNDANVPVENVYDLQSRFEVCNKTNLSIHVFEGHDHDLNFLDRITHKKWSKGYEEIFSTANSYNIE